MTAQTPAAPAEAFAFSSENLAIAREIIRRYPEGRQASAVIPLLMLAQRQNAGWLPPPALNYVASYLEIPEIRVYEVATFYTMFNLKPVGRYHVQVCTNISCWLRGSDQIVEACREALGIGLNQTTADGQFTLSEVECLGACVNAPMVQIGLDYYEDLSPDSMIAILEALKAGQTPRAGSQIGRCSSEPARGGGASGFVEQKSGA